jgi:hypothetical protein
MNPSANINQTHDATTCAVRTAGLEFLRRTVAGALLASAVTAIAAGLAATSHADEGAPAPNLGGPAQAGAICETEPWGFLGSQRRTLCDGPISSDGSWSRERTIWAPGHYSAPICTSWSGSDRYSYYNNCSGGYFIPERLVSNETYPVRAETVLNDEPGHLG